MLVGINWSWFHGCFFWFILTTAIGCAASRPSVHVCGARPPVTTPGGAMMCHAGRVSLSSWSNHKPSGLPPFNTLHLTRFHKRIHWMGCEWPFWEGHAPFHGPVSITENKCKGLYPEHDIAWLYDPMGSMRSEQKPSCQQQVQAHDLWAPGVFCPKPHYNL